MTMKNDKTARKVNIDMNGTKFLLAIFVVASLMLLGAGTLAASQNHEVNDTARAPPLGYYTMAGPDGISIRNTNTQVDPITELPPVKEFTTNEGGLSGFSSGISHV